MKVLHITNAYPYEEYQSFGIFIKEQIESLHSIGVENKVIFLNARERGYKEYFRQIKNIHKVIKIFNPDVIHCHHEFSLIPMALIRTTKPIVLSLLGDLQKRSALNKVVYDTLKIKVNKVILKNKNISDTRYAYLPNGVNLKLFHSINKSRAKSILKLDDSIKYILFVTATLDNPIKRYDKFEKVVQKINEKLGENYQSLVMCGVSRDLVPYYFNSAEFLLLTSEHEGSPNAIKEAMACNLPIVSTDVGNVKELVGLSKGHFISRTGSINDLYNLSIEALQQDKSEGRVRIEALELDISSVARNLHKLYQNLL